MTASIIFHEDSREFHLCNDKISYIMTILKNGELGQLYFGKSLRDLESFGHFLELQKRPMSACAFPGDQSFSMEHIRQEYPSFGHGDMRYPAYEIEQSNGSRITEFVYRSHKIYVGKPKLEQLPATYTELDEEAQTLEVELEDSLIRTWLVLTYTIYRDYPVITRNARFECGLPEGIRLNTAMYQYILGVYSLYERLVEKFPEVLFESCASGGARFDPGMLYYAPQCWTSDDTDAMERLKIQYGTSMVYPLSSMGSHVSAIPNHQLHRNVPMNSRANVAYFGTFGYELDLNELTEEERDTIKNQVQFMKKHRKLIQQGNF